MNPLDRIFNSLTLPVIFLDLDEYSILSHWSSVYVKTFGKVCGENLNVFSSTPKTLYLPSYSLSTNLISEWFTTSVSAVLINPPLDNA